MSGYTREYLASQAARYAAAKPPVQEDFAPIPDGMYTVEITECAVLESRRGDPYLRWMFKVVDGPHAGRVISRANMLATDQNLAYLKGDLAIAGMQLTDLTQLPDLAGDLVGRRLEIKAQTKGDRQSIYLKSLVVPGAVNNDYIPF